MREQALAMSDVDRAAMMCLTFAAYCSSNLAGFYSRAEQVGLLLFMLILSSQAQHCLTTSCTWFASISSTVLLYRASNCGVAF